MDNDVCCVYVIPEGGGEPIRLNGIKEVVFDTDDSYSYNDKIYDYDPICAPHICLFDDETYEFSFRLKRDIEKELAPRYFKKNKEKNLTCVWTDRKRVVGMLRDLDRWAGFVKLLKNEMKGGLK